MTHRKPHRLGDLQHRILKVLWDQGESTVADVHAALGGSSAFAYTTIATMLRKMEARHLVKHRSEGRSFIYTAAVAEGAVARGMVDDLIDRVFEGSLSEAVNHLLTTRDVSPAELRKLEALIAQHKKRV